LWNDNFSDARNYSISKAYFDHILVLDSDEIIEKINTGLGDNRRAIKYYRKCGDYIFAKRQMDILEIK
jgi:hypothetical protein